MRKLIFFILVVALALIPFTTAIATGPPTGLDPPQVFVPYLEAATTAGPLKMEITTGPSERVASPAIWQTGLYKKLIQIVQTRGSSLDISLLCTTVARGWPITYGGSVYKFTQETPSALAPKYPFLTGPEPSYRIRV